METPPCGGALEGTWDYIAGCVSDADLADLEREIQKGCPSASLDKVSGSMSGRVIFAGKTVVRKATISINADVSIPKVCADQAGGNCSFVAVAIKSAGGAQVKAATCANVADGCACTLETAVAADKSGTTFTTTGNTLLTSDGDEYSFCVAAGKLTHKQTKPGNPALVEPGAYEATKR